MNRRELVGIGLGVGAFTLVGGVAVAQSAAGTAEATHTKDTQATGSLALISSRLAVKNASDSYVREFANLEVAEQETIADVLKTMSTNAQPTGTVKAPTDDEAAAHLDAAGKAAIEKLKSVKGAAFDRAYVQAQIEGHQKLLGIQESYLANGKNREQVGYAKLARGVIKEHLVLLGKIQSSLKA